MRSGSEVKGLITFRLSSCWGVRFRPAFDPCDVSVHARFLCKIYAIPPGVPLSSRREQHAKPNGHESAFGLACGYERDMSRPTGCVSIEPQAVLDPRPSPGPEPTVGIGFEGVEAGEADGYDSHEFGERQANDGTHASFPDGDERL